MMNQGELTSGTWVSQIMSSINLFVKHPLWVFHYSKRNSRSEWHVPKALLSDPSSHICL